MGKSEPEFACIETKSVVNVQRRVNYYETLTSLIDTEAYSELSKMFKMEIFWSH